MKTLIIISLLFVISGIPDNVSGSKSPVVENQTIVFTTLYSQSRSFYHVMSDIYTEAFGRMGYGFKLISQPGERAMIDANKGIVDGEAGRIMSLDRKQYPNLIRVPHDIVTMMDGGLHVLLCYEIRYLPGHDRVQPFYFCALSK